MTQDFSAQIAAFKTRRLRDRHRRRDPARRQDLPRRRRAAGLQAQGHHGRQGAAVPAAIEALGDLGDGLSTEVWWTPVASVQVVAHEAERQRARRRLASAASASSGRSRSASRTRCSRSPLDVLKRAQDPHDREAMRDAIAATNSRRWSVRSTGPGSPVKNVTKTPLVAASGRKDGKFDLVIVDNKTAPNIPLGRQAGADRLTHAMTPWPRSSRWKTSRSASARWW